ncbi:HNH endonuclease [Gallaecimonas pentaromativorans]|uniref:HNH endonuclease n=1 Tax=Gallaecimonas pentaromativorans TaxID=584787 RepID=UPI0009FA8A60|nr:HNH endonuclease [Gallaecimonas pentaromativorans]
MFSDQFSTTVTAPCGDVFVFLSSDNLAEVAFHGGPLSALRAFRLDDAVDALARDDWSLMAVWRLIGQRALMQPASTQQALFDIRQAIDQRDIYAFCIERDLENNLSPPGTTSISGASSSVTESPRTASATNSSSAKVASPVSRVAETNEVQAAPVPKEGTTRIYGGTDLPDGGYTSVGANVYCDPNTASFADEPNRKPTINAKERVEPYEGTRPEGVTVAIFKKELAGDTVTAKKGGKTYICEKDDKGFPIFTTYDTYIDNEHIGSAKEKEHFKAANENLLKNIEKDPTLAKKMGLTKMDLRNMKKNSSKAPDGFVWHHHQDVGRMQLVRADLHDSFRHSGGMAIWGGGR